MVSDRLKKLAEKEELTEDEVMELTLEECHRVLWWWLHLTGCRVKGLAPILRVRPATQDCYACDQRKCDAIIMGSWPCNNVCWYCPIDWLVKFRVKMACDLYGLGHCCANGSPFYKWKEAKTKWWRKRYAKKIALMPWSEKC